MKAVILTRVSTKEQEEGHSLPAQNTRLSEYAKRKGFEVIKTFQIIESSTRGKRKEFMQMIDFCKQQPETIAIIADAVDRIQRSFKESVMLDDLIRQEKIELHFFREGMIIGKRSSSTDIMRWDFSVMGAKAYVLQLSENVRRSIDYKIRNGEFAGAAPTGYENFIDEKGKHSIRPKEPDASKVRMLFEKFSLGGVSVNQLAKYADALQLRSRTGHKITNTSLSYMLDNPFYYGEMVIKGNLQKHVYEPLITKDLWDQCQEQRKKCTTKPFRHGSIPFLYRGLITCLNSGKTCLQEIKKQKFYYLVCFKPDGTRLYVPEKDITSQISYILHGIYIPQDMIEAFKEHLKNSKDAEMHYKNAEIGRLQAEATKARQRLCRLFDLRLDGEIEKEDYETKRAQLQLEIDRAEATIRAHDKSDDKFDETLIGLFDIASKAWDVFDNSEDIELKRLLMKFVFEKLNISNGTIYYKLRFPFSEMEFVSKLGLNEKDGQNPENRIVAEPLINKASSDKISEFKISENNDFRTVKNDVKTKTCDIKSQVSPNWLLHLDSNQD